MFFLAVVADRIQRNIGLEKWQVSLMMLGLAVLLYVTNVFLIKYFIRKRTPELATDEEVLPGVQAWEITAGLGVVPKWVSFLGLLSISAVVTAVVPWIIALFR